jgi:fibronectin type 3 domain-containing protein
MLRRKSVPASWLVYVLFALSAAFVGCGGGGGGDSTPAVTAPSAPTSVTANAGDNVVTVDWSPVAGATSFNIYHGTAPGVSKTTGTKVSGVQSPNTVSGLTNGTPYYFVVTAVNSAGESSESAERTATPSATPPPLAPGNIRAEAGDSQATISWDAVGGATSYNIYVGTSAGVTMATGLKASGVTSPSVVTPLANGTKFYFVVTAVGTGGESAESFEVSATPAATPPPAAPGGVSAVPGNAQATVSWSPVTGATSYNLYWATASGVTKATGTEIAGVTSPKDVTSLANGTKYYFVVTAVGAGGESTESSEVYATPVAPAGAFLQSDLAGTWDLVFFFNGMNPSWWRGTATISGSGGITVTSGLDSGGSTSVPAAGTITWTISSTGVVSEGGSGGNVSFHGQMSSNKRLVIGTVDWGTDNTVTMRVARKRTGTTFTSADLANKTLTLHILHTGTDNEWFYGAGATDGTGLFTFTSAVKPSGPVPPEPGGVLSVNSAGIVTTPGDTTWYGLMTDDKKVIFWIDGTSNSYSFGVFTVTGQTYTQSDLAGTYNFSAIRNTLVPSWSYGNESIDAGGTLTYLTYTDSAGGAAPASSSRVLSASGVITAPGDTSFHAQLSYNKDLWVRTNTNASGRYGLSINFK